MTIDGEQVTEVGTRVCEAATQVAVHPQDSHTPIRGRQVDDGTARDDAHVEVAAAVEGDRQAIERLLAIIRPLVVRYCRARVGRQERSFASADDVAQEVCLAVFTALPRYRQEGRPFLSFVYGIAAHKVADAHRVVARNRYELVPEVPEAVAAEAGPEQRALEGELSERMTQLLLVLPEKHREIVVLRVVVGLSAEETADAVGSTPGAIRVMQHRALARLRKSLTGVGSEVASGGRVSNVDGG